VGIITLLEMLNFWNETVVGETEMSLFGVSFDVSGTVPWVVVPITVVVGFLATKMTVPQLRAAWAEASSPVAEGDAS
jgi:hypothetical protein